MATETTEEWADRVVKESVKRWAREERPMRVLLRGDHPWASHAGDVVERETSASSPMYKVRLDNGQEVIVWPAQMRVIDDGGDDT